MYKQIRFGESYRLLHSPPDFFITSDFAWPLHNQNNVNRYQEPNDSGECMGKVSKIVFLILLALFVLAYIFRHLSWD
jgi:hypothetical protein